LVGLCEVLGRLVRARRIVVATVSLEVFAAEAHHAALWGRLLTALEVAETRRNNARGA
jgi:hypothetical protein